MDKATFGRSSFGKKQLLDEATYWRSNFWMKQLLDEATFGKSNFWTKQLLDEATFGTSNFWMKQLLDEATFGRSKFCPKQLLSMELLDHSTYLIQLEENWKKWLNLSCWGKRWIWVWPNSVQLVSYIVFYDIFTVKISYLLFKDEIWGIWTYYN